MSNLGCGSIHQGHERFILVMNLEEGKRFLCVWLFYYVSNFCRFANGARCQDQVLLHVDNFLHSAFSSSFLKILLFGVNYRLQFAGLGRNRKRGRCEVNLLYVENESNRSHYSSPVEELNLIVESESLPTEVNDLNIEL